MGYIKQALAHAQLSHYARSEQLENGAYLEYVNDHLIQFKIENQVFRYKPRKRIYANYKGDVMAVPEGEIHILSIDMPTGKLVINKRMVIELHKDGIVLKLANGRLYTSVTATGENYEGLLSYLSTEEQQQWKVSGSHFMQVRAAQDEFIKLWREI